MAKKSKLITSSGYIGAQDSTIVLQNINRFNTDIQAYMSAIASADRIDYPMRARLYDLYVDILGDAHLSSVSGKRIGAVLRKPIEFVRGGVRDEAIMEHLNSPWFWLFRNDLLDTVGWGESLFQFYRDEKGWIKYISVPRKHIDSKNRLILRMQDGVVGESWDSFENLLYVKSQNRLGLLAKAAPYVIYKRNDIGDWAQFCEIFGMPIREYVYDSNDEEAREQTYRDAAEQGGAGIYIHPEGTQLNFRESGNKTGSSDLYMAFAKFLNDELSKLYLGNTLTTETAGNGNRALGEIHSEEEDKFLDADEQFEIAVLNYEMTDIFAALGIDTRGGTFQYVQSKKVNKKELLETVSKLYQMGLPIDEDWCYETFGVRKPVGTKGALVKQAGEPVAGAASLLPTADGSEAAGRDAAGKDGAGKDGAGTVSTNRGGTLGERVRRFFDLALRRRAPLSW